MKTTVVTVIVILNSCVRAIYLVAVLVTMIVRVNTYFVHVKQRIVAVMATNLVLV